MSSNQPVKKPIEILFSYAREDEKLRDELEKGLSAAFLKYCNKTG